MSNVPFDIDSNSSLKWADVQLGQVYTAIFGFLCYWGAHNIYSSYYGWRKRPQIIFLLNFLQTSSLFIKTVSATVYATYFNLNCAPRGPLVNIPMMISWDLIYVMMLLKIIIFSDRKKSVIILFGLGIATHICVIIAGVALRTSSMSSNWTCRDVYPLVYKQQYIVEIILEVIAVGFLFDGLFSKQQGTMFVQTFAILNQLKENENLRIFAAMIFIIIKIALSYSNPPFDTRALTHFIDSCRSATVCWAILREPQTVQKAVAKSREGSLRPMGQDSYASVTGKRKFVDSPGPGLSSFGPIEESELENHVRYHDFPFESTNHSEVGAVEIPLVSADTLAGE